MGVLIKRVSRKKNVLLPLASELKEPKKFLNSGAKD